jgi:hypothetical protein
LNNTLLNNQLVIEEIKREMKTFLDSNENEDTTLQNLWDTGKAVLRRKFIDMNIHIRKLKRSQINNLVMYYKLLGKQEQDSPTSNRWKEIINIRTKINKWRAKE